MNHVIVKSFLGIIFRKGQLCCPNCSHFCNEQCMFLSNDVFWWNEPFLLIWFFANHVHFWKSIFTPSKNKTNRTDWKNAQVLKFNSADAGKGILNLVTSTMERTIFSCLSPMLWWYREPSKSLTKSSEVLLFWRKK